MGGVDVEFIGVGLVDCLITFRLPLTLDGGVRWGVDGRGRTGGG